MGITARNTNSQSVLNELKRGHRTIENGIIKILQYAGEQFVIDAKDALKISGNWKQRILTEKEIAKGRTQPKWGDYLDDTDNLRSSIGYFVLNNGVIVDSMVEGTPEGVSAARTLLNEIPNKSGYQLIGVAGMDYASAVESKGYNVITSQKDVAIVNIERNLVKFKDRMNKKGNSVDFDIDSLVLTSTR